MDSTSVAVWAVCLTPLLLITAFAVWQAALTALADRWLAAQETRRKRDEWAVWARGVGAVPPRDYPDAMPLCPGCGKCPEHCRFTNTCLDTICQD